MSQPIIQQLPVFVSKFTSADFTPEEWAAIQRPSVEAAERADTATTATINAKELTEAATKRADTATINAVNETNRLTGVIAQGMQEVAYLGAQSDEMDIKLLAAQQQIDETKAATTLTKAATTKANTASDQCVTVTDECGRMITMTSAELDKVQQVLSMMHNGFGGGDAFTDSNIPV